jgi:hypothetical protein
MVNRLVIFKALEKLEGTMPFEQAIKQVAKELNVSEIECRLVWEYLNSLG